jgi:hypothetical protein
MRTVHRDVEHLLDSRLEAVYFVDEEDGSLLERREDAREILGLVEGRGARRLEVGPELVGHDEGEGRLAEARGPHEEEVVEGLLALAGRADEDLEILLVRRLALEFGEVFWPEGELALVLGIVVFGIHRPGQA